MDVIGTHLHSTETFGAIDTSGTKVPGSNEASAPTTAPHLLDGLPVEKTVPMVMKLGAAAVVEMSKEPINRDGAASIYRFRFGSKVFAGKFDVTGDKLDDLDSLKREYGFHKRASGHENIAEPYGVAVHPLNGECQPVLMMELVDGINCHQLRLGMRAALKNGYISYSEFCGMEAAVRRDELRAIAHWTRQGMVHCDLKPQNVMVERATGNAKVVDFGLAQNVDTAWVGPYGYKAPEQFGSGTELDAVEEPKRPRIGAETDPFAAGASTLAAFEGDDDGLLDAPVFFQLDSYLTDLKPLDLNANDRRYTLAGAVASLRYHLQTFYEKLNEKQLCGRFSPDEVEALGKEFEGLCREWLEAYTAQVLNDDGRYNLSSLKEFANRDVFSDLVKAFKEAMTTTGALSQTMLSEVRPSNTGFIVERKVTKDKSGNVIHRRGVFAAETALTEFMDLTMKRRCTAEQALSSPFIADSVVDEGRSKQLLKMVVEKTHDGSIFKPKAGAKASQSVSDRQHALTNRASGASGTEQFTSDIETREGSGLSFQERKRTLERQLSRQSGGYRVGTVRIRANFYDRLGPGKTAGANEKGAPSKKRKLSEKKSG